MAHEDELRKQFGARLKQARKACALTLEQVGEKLTALGWSASKQTVGHWETGRNLPDPMVLRKLCRLYQVSADLLLWGVDDEEQPQLPGFDTEVMQRLSLATPDQRAAVRTMVVTLLDTLKVPAATPAATPGKQRRAA